MKFILIIIAFSQNGGSATPIATYNSLEKCEKNKISLYEKYLIDEKNTILGTIPKTNRFNNGNMSIECIESDE